MNTTPEQRAEWAKLVHDPALSNAKLLDAYAPAVPSLLADVEELEGLVAHFRGQRDHLIAECGRVGVQVNVRIGEPDLTKAYVLENAQVERLTALLREAVPDIKHADYRHPDATGNQRWTCYSECLRCRIEKELQP